MALHADLLRFRHHADNALLPLGLSHPIHEVYELLLREGIYWLGLPRFAPENVRDICLRILLRLDRICSDVRADDKMCHGGILLQEIDQEAETEVRLAPPPVIRHFVLVLELQRQDRLRLRHPRERLLGA